MSGHSKWATIHRQKEIKDAKRGAAFTKLAMAITVAVRQGGGIGDADKNFRLRLAIDKARTFNMPKENIQRAIDKGVGGAGSASLDEAMYEGFLPGGAGVLVETLSDNRLRTAQEVRMILEKNGGTMGNSGSVSYLFTHVGQLKIRSHASKARDEQELEMIDAGIDDIEEVDEGFLVWCNKDKTFEIKNKLEQLGYVVDSAELVFKPMSFVDGTETGEKIVELLEDLDDVSHVWTNAA